METTLAAVDRNFEKSGLALVRCVLLLALGLIASAGTAGAQTYTVTDLGVLSGDTSSWGIFINASGQATGCSDTSTTQGNLCNFVDPGEAFVWSSANGMKSLGTLPGDDLSIGFFISDAGEVVGSSYNLQTQNGHGFSWTQKSGMVDLGALTGTNGYSGADLITATGLIVGQSELSNGDVDAVYWTKSGSTYTIHDLGRLPSAPYVYPYGINNENQIVGIAYFNAQGTEYHGFFASQTKGWKDLGTLTDGQLSVAEWINDSGIIVGQSTSTAYPNGVAVYWDASHNIHPIGTLPGGTTSFGGYISDSNIVLGESNIASGDTHAFTWTAKAGFTDLNNQIPANSGWDLNHASAMNATGQIVGFGTINGATHGFLLTPTLR